MRFASYLTLNWCIIHFRRQGFKSIDKAEYVNNLEGEKPLTDPLDLEFVLDYFKENDSEFPELNRFELARRIWNINHIDNEVPKIEMPNYKNILI